MEVETVRLKRSSENTGAWTVVSNPLNWKNKNEGTSLYNHETSILKDEINKRIFANQDTALGYRFKIKDFEKTYYINDPGTKTEDGLYNVIAPNQGATTMTGPMYHMFINSFAPSKEAKENMETRTHFNDAGGNIQGVIEHLNNSNSLDPYKFIFSTPIIGADNVSSHGYWTANPYQLSEKAGTIEDYKELQKTLLEKGKTWIIDGAFTSQGLNSPQLSHVLKWGSESPFYNWLRLEDESIKIGLFSSKILNSAGEENLAAENLRYKLVNAPNSTGYDQTKPTYLQFYDDRLATDEQKKSNNLIDKYGKFNTNNPYDIKEHQDSTQPYAIEINPDNKSKIGILKKYEGQPLVDSGISDELFEFKAFKIVNKSKAGNATFWVGNVDLVKMNLANSQNSNPMSEIGSTQARSYMYNVAKYWTRLTDSILVENLAKKMSKHGQTLALMDLEKAYNIETNDYFKIFNQAKNVPESDFIKKVKNDKDFILKEITDFPLESIEFSKELTSVLSSPYITIRPVRKQDQNLSKFDLMSDNFVTEDGKNTYGNYLEYASKSYQNDKKATYTLKNYSKINDKMNSLYKNEINEYTIKTLKQLEKELGQNIFDQNGNITTYGAYVARNTIPEIVKFAITKSLFGNMAFKQGTYDYDYKKMKNLGLKALDINAATAPTPQDEADILIKKLEIGLNKLLNSDDDKLAKVLAMDLKGISAKDFMLADTVIKEIKMGLNWRFDAARDVSDIEARLDGRSNLESCWDDTIDFWKNFISNIKEENPSSYTIAEITDLYDYYYMNKDNQSMVDFGKYKDAPTAERMFFEETGASTSSNYSYTFSTVPGFVARIPEDGNTRYTDNSDAVIREIKSCLDGSPLTMITNSHVFMNNHDKPRPLHCFALGEEMEYFLYGHEDSKENGFKNRVQKVLGTDRTEIDNLSSEAITVASILMNHFKSVINNEFKNDKELLPYINEAIKDLALGKFKEYKTENFRRAKAFGSEDYNIVINQVIEQAKYIALNSNATESVLNKLNNQEKISKIKAKTHEAIIKESLKNFEEAWAILNTMLGNATLYSGDEYAQTGHEDPSKNNKVKNRNIVRHDIIGDKNYQYINEFNQKINEISSLYKKTSEELGIQSVLRYPLSALAGGIPSVLYSNSKEQMFGVFKYDDKGSQVISIYQPKNNDTEVDEIRLYDIPDFINEDANFVRLIYKDGKYKAQKTPYIFKKNHELKNPYGGGTHKGPCLIRKDGKEIELKDQVSIFVKAKI